MPTTRVITDKHFRGIGRIIVVWARLERAMIGALSALLQTHLADAVIAFWHLSYNDKRDRIISLVHWNLSEPDEAFKKQFKSLMDRMEAAASLRNLVAHSTWKKGKGRATITPLVIVARGGPVKIGGHDLKEEIFTADRLEAEAKQIERLYEDFKHFFATHFDAAFTVADDRKKWSRKKRSH